MALPHLQVTRKATIHAKTEKGILAITLFVLRTAKCGDPGGVWCNNSEVKAVFAICIHSSRVFRKVSQVDFNRAPISIPVCGKKPIGRHGLTTEDQVGATNIYKAHRCYSHDFCLMLIKTNVSAAQRTGIMYYWGHAPSQHYHSCQPLTRTSTVCLRFKSNAS